MDQAVNVEYIFHRDPYTDHAYGTGDWTPGEVKAVPADVAARMLRHTDVFKESKKSGKPASADKKGAPSENPNRNEQQEENMRVDELKAQVGTMNKAALRAFAESHYQQRLDGRMSAEDTRAKVIALIDQYGLQ